MVSSSAIWFVYRKVYEFGHAIITRWLCLFTGRVAISLLEFWILPPRRSSLRNIGVHLLSRTAVTKMCIGRG